MPDETTMAATMAAQRTAARILVFMWGARHCIAVVSQMGLGTGAFLPCVGKSLHNSPPQRLLLGISNIGDQAKSGHPRRRRRSDYPQDAELRPRAAGRPPLHRRRGRPASPAG